MAKQTAVTKARKRLQDFDPRGSKCPICGMNFRNGCKHSVTEAREYLNTQLMQAIAREAVNTN